MSRLDALLARAREAFRTLAGSPIGLRRAFAVELHRGVSRRREEVLAAMQADGASRSGAQALDAALGRLEQVGRARDPLAASFERDLPGGGELWRQRTPMGVVAAIHEDDAAWALHAAALAVLCGDALVLRPSRRAREAARVLRRCLRSALRRAGLPVDAVQVVLERGHAAARGLVRAAGQVDLALVRGAPALAASARVPVVAAGAGVNHLYVDASADPEAAADLVADSRTAHAARCTSLQAALLHEAVAEAVLARLAGRVALLACPRAGVLLSGLGASWSAAGDADWDGERKSPVLAVRVVDGVEEALAHVRRHGSGHSEGVAARDATVVERFREAVDATFVLVNASFRTLTGQGLGMDTPGIGVQTEGRRGLLGVDALTGRRWVVRGADQRDAFVESARALVLPHHDTPSEILGMPARCFVRGDGVWLTDHRGRTYLDGLSMLWVASLGHGQPSIVEAVTRQARRLSYGTLYGGFLHEPALELASLLREVAPGRLEASFFATGGAEAVESALKLARAYHLARGDHSRRKVLSFKGSYHGMTLGALAASGVPALRAPFEPLPSEFRKVDAPYCPACPLGMSYPSCAVACADRVGEALDAEGPEEVSAMLAEPILSPMAAWTPPPEYWPRVRDHLTRRGVLLIMDEVRTGLGRTGSLFACEQWGLEPDLLVLGKALSGGYAPISAVVVSRDLAETLRDHECHEGFTFGGHPLGAAAAVASLRMMLDMDLPAAARVQGERLAQWLRDGLADVSDVCGVWGRGLQLAVAYGVGGDPRQPLPREARVPWKVERVAWDAGIYLGRASPTVTHVAPPLIIEDAPLQHLAEGVVSAVRATLR